MTTTMSALAAAAGLLLFVFAMLSAAVSDLTTYKIRNNLILTLLLAYLAFAPVVGITCQEIGRSIAVAGLVLFLSFALFAAGWIGGGDAKLATVTTLWLGADNAFSYFLFLSLLGDRLRRFDLADQAYATAIKLTGETVQILNDRGYSYLLRGDLSKARAKFLRAYQLDPTNPTVINNIALLNSSYRFVQRVP
jgi:tetratricopeptide (TPR) repeat protein